MWLKILCIEYILWGIPTIESTFDVANMVKSATVKDVPINNDVLLNIQACYVLNSCLGKLYLLSYLVVLLISARDPPISTRVSAHCQAILLSWHYIRIRAGVKYVLSNTTTNTKIWIFQIQIFCSTLIQIQIQIQIHRFKYKYKYVRPNISAETVRIKNRAIL